MTTEKFIVICRHLLIKYQLSFQRNLFSISSKSQKAMCSSAQNALYVKTLVSELMKCVIQILAPAKPESGESGEGGQPGCKQSRSEIPGDQPGAAGTDPGNSGAKGHHSLPHIKSFASHSKHKERRSMMFFYYFSYLHGCRNIRILS